MWKIETMWGRSKECRSLLKNIIMAMLKKNPGHGIKSARRRQVLTSLSNDAAWRLLQSSGENRKRFKEMNMQDLRAVEEEADRLKFPDKEIDDLQLYMCDNLYTRDSPNEKDTLRKGTSMVNIIDRSCIALHNHAHNIVII